MVRALVSVSYDHVRLSPQVPVTTFACRAMLHSTMHRKMDTFFIMCVD